MEETAQNKIIQFPNHEQDLIKNVHPDVENVAGHPVNRADLDPEDDSSLKKIREGLGNVVHISGKAAGGIGESLGGGEVTHIEEAPASKWGRVWHRLRRMKGVFKSLAQKAA